MTELAAADLAEAATHAAGRAAHRAGVRVRDLRDLAELQLATAVFGEVWPSGPGGAPCTLDMLRALTKAGNYVSGAFRAGELVGACVGFFGPPAQAAMHSHVAAVLPGVRNRDVGFAIKLHQRAWALRRGVARVSWTFDPLVSRNAYFNLGKLAGDAVEYLPNFYGEMDDAVNAGDESDRLVVDWDLRSARVVRATEGAPPAPAASPEALLAGGAAVGLSPDQRDRPVVGTPAGPVVLVGIPRDIESLRRSDMDTARAWRFALRQVLGGLLAEGARVTGYLRSGWYVVRTA
ncbi:MAG: GNAT family N-acetyltransferase [Micromonosporaceae bacterium]|nr:GNAT family N-acetyltransferase [Micromonosporaceae bacterium]